MKLTITEANDRNRVEIEVKDMHLMLDAIGAVMAALWFGQNPKQALPTDQEVEDARLDRARVEAAKESRREEIKKQLEELEELEKQIAEALQARGPWDRLELNQEAWDALGDSLRSSADLAHWILELPGCTSVRAVLVPGMKTPWLLCGPLQTAPPPATPLHQPPLEALLKRIAEAMEEEGQVGGTVRLNPAAWALVWPQPSQLTKAITLALGPGTVLARLAPDQEQEFQIEPPF